METAANYGSVEGVNFFRNAKQRILFQQFVKKHPEQIVDTYYEHDDKKQMLRLTVDNEKNKSRYVFLRQDFELNGEYIIATTESPYTATAAQLFLTLSMMSWDGRPIYTPALNDEMRMVLGCSKKTSALDDATDFYEIILGLSEAMDRLEAAWERHSLFPYLWSAGVSPRRMKV